MSSLRPCLICNASSYYAHFGVDACRNCAAFYKRMVTAGRSFLCRQGDGKCTINPKDRHNCRGCRFARCKQFGMNITSEETSAQLPSVSPEPSSSLTIDDSRETSTHRPCLICTAPSFYAHFGVYSCRNCADFYKRTITAGRSFVCRNGDGKCAMNPKDRNNCRGCRFARCRHFGMSITAEEKSVEQLPEVPPSAPHQEPETCLSRVCREHLASVARRKICEIKMQRTVLIRHINPEVPGEVRP
ncbi:hypothetical protein PENTCL1PPCAC_8016 [Pristionchus entomophagus]|uniref:Nuclear receptor domain-containing protein n=1 Tax=Pristionchus entomophagus TaxID=358040 RepID=A0AAV5SR40_9BILA|nr:hypothetical protein PENTCL1PPCAC_8016 [Pristionchus entomophagus]